MYNAYCIAQNYLWISRGLKKYRFYTSLYEMVTCYNVYDHISNHYTQTITLCNDSACRLFFISQNKGLKGFLWFPSPFCCCSWQVSFLLHKVVHSFINSSKTGTSFNVYFKQIKVSMPFLAVLLLWNLGFVTIEFIILSISGNFATISTTAE